MALEKTLGHKPHDNPKVQTPFPGAEHGKVIGEIRKGVRTKTYNGPSLPRRKARVTRAPCATKEVAVFVGAGASFIDRALVTETPHPLAPGAVATRRQVRTHQRFDRIRACAVSGTYLRKTDVVAQRHLDNFTHDGCIQRYDRLHKNLTKT